ncbi:uncharacterized protein LOC120184881 [Hibiscus syriacus]|uniref:uncharacterized protein LOC120184881 n=1 Tax=Hibiscus syriacus TaxID=106335 RepID=UPI0019233007|nr:uncharacterized protein LOC120184881 [Hibiscus syriacus]
MKERFDKIDGSRVFFLHRSIATLLQVNQAYSIIAQEESQHILSEGSTDSSVMFSSLSNASRGTDQKRFSSVCEYCKIRGHRKENYYRPIKFPSDFRFTEKKTPPTAMALNSESTDFLNSDSSFVPVVSASMVFTFAIEQHNQILSLLNKAPTLAFSVNLTGTVACDLLAIESLLLWILDTGLQATSYLISKAWYILFHFLNLILCICLVNLNW